MFVDLLCILGSQQPEEELQPILRDEVEITVAALHKWKSAEVDNIPAEFLQAGGETKIYNKTWKTGDWPTLWTQSLVITLPKKNNIQLCQNCLTISLISIQAKSC